MNLSTSSFTFLLCVSVVTGQSVLNATTCDSKLFSPRSDVAVAYDGVDSIYIFGGVFFTPDWNLLVYDEVHRFNVTSDEIEVIAKLPQTAHGGHAHFRNDVGDILYLRADGTFLWSFNVTSGNTTSLSEWLGSSAGVGITYLQDSVIAFGGLDDATSIYSYDLQTSTQTVTGTLPLPSELAVSLHLPTQDETFIFAGELGNRSPLIMSYDHLTNSTSTLSWTFPSWRHGDGSPVLVHKDSTSFMYLLGAVVDNGARGNTLTTVDLNSGDVQVISLDGLPDELTSTAAVYVEKLNRIYLVGGYDLKNEDKENIWYIQL